LISRAATVVALIAAIGVTTVAASPAAERRAALRLTDGSPITVTGVRFAAGERATVRIVIRGRGSFAKSVLVGRAGSFTARFADRSLPQCAGYLITARDTSGTRAEVRELIPPPCGIDLQQ
jgi:hypothetical protein